MRCCRSRKCWRAKFTAFGMKLANEGDDDGHLPLTLLAEARRSFDCVGRKNAPNSAQDDSVYYTNLRDRTLAQSDVQILESAICPGTFDVEHDDVLAGLLVFVDRNWSRNRCRRRSPSANW